MAVCGEAGTAAGSGGMITKVKAARVLMVAGIPLVICNGRREGAIEDAAAGRPVGTLFAASSRPHEITPKKLWIALGDAARGALAVDEGRQEGPDRSRLVASGGGRARRRGALRRRRHRRHQGSRRGTCSRRGRVSAESDEVELAEGLDQKTLAGNRLLAHLAERPLVHRDSLVELSRSSACPPTLREPSLTFRSKGRFRSYEQRPD